MLYDLLLTLILLVYRLWSVFDTKAALFFAGRRHWRKRHADAFKKTGRVVWFHAASLGEFEQGRPLIEAYRNAHPDHQLILTFFSPSGYEIRKQYTEVDYVWYLPVDTRRNAEDFITMTQPDLVVFIKYEFWYNYLMTLKRRNIPVLLISAAFRENQPFFKWYGSAWRSMLEAFLHIFVQQDSDKELLNSIGFQHVTVAGDTRVDRVLRIAEHAPENEKVAAFCGQSQVIICGSTWEKDEKLLLEIFCDPKFAALKWIIAPHKPSEDHCKKLVQSFGTTGVTLFSDFTEKFEKHCRVLIIDNIGLLAGLYRYGHMAYIGGGFGAGIHNTLEPAAFGLPVLFGPRFQKFYEARRMVKTGGAFAIESAVQMREVLNKLQDTDVYSRAANSSQRYIEENKAATAQILAWINRNFSV